MGITNHSQWPIGATLLPDGFIDYSASTENDQSATVDTQVTEPGYVLVAVGETGSFRAVDGTNLSVPLDGKPHFAVLPRKLLP